MTTGQTPRCIHRGPNSEVADGEDLAVLAPYGPFATPYPPWWATTTAPACPPWRVTTTAPPLATR